jgi:hypothetical protein
MDPDDRPYDGHWALDFNLDELWGDLKALKRDAAKVLAMVDTPQDATFNGELNFLRSGIEHDYTVHVSIALQLSRDPNCRNWETPLTTPEDDREVERLWEAFEISKREQMTIDAARPILRDLLTSVLANVNAASSALGPKDAPTHDPAQLERIRASLGEAMRQSFTALGIAERLQPPDPPQEDDDA